MRTAVFLSLFALLASPLARADIAPPSQKGVTHRILVEGLDRFPGMTFVAYPTSFSDSLVVVEEGESFSFYKLSQPFLYAIPGEAPAEVTKEHLLGDGVARSELGFESISSVPDSDPTERINTTYRIVGIENGVVLLEKGDSLRFDQQSNPVGAMRQDRPAVLVVIAIVALCGIVLLVTLRRRQALGAGSSD